MDASTENVIVADIQRAFRWFHNNRRCGDGSVIIGSSHINQVYFFKGRKILQSVGPEIPVYQIDRLQRLQNQAARVVMNVYDQPSADLRKSLHGLPVKARIMFKVILIVFRVIQGTAPTYLLTLFNCVRRKYSLRSAADDTCSQFVVPRRRTRLGDRSISVMGPKWWNALPKDLKCIASEIAFRKRLKAHLFEQFYR
ncbi:uncharacterized protein LOC132757163 [Ruditapes philippinarum]|uniref:uncharacterized protein LOC132757163 n=1 Tax=Ruditapes philippinarum TaxID=129788 RepID=UPI00295A6365|nr:uncharacterized protein LOC132757163 [Ruditapes philippinarum]